MREPQLPHVAAFVVPLETSDAVVSAARSVVASTSFDGWAARFHAFAEIAATDLALARIVEGHVDATTILAEATIDPHPGLYGVWAADSPDHRVTATRDGDDWLLRGRKRFCSGAGLLDRALVTAEGGLLFDVALGGDDVRPIPGTWQAVGMATTQSLDVVFDNARVAAPIGEPDFYLSRAGFWHGAVGVAACWYGGALGAMRMLRERCTHAMTDHQAAHLGAVVAECAAMRIVLDAAATEIDRVTDGVDPAGRYRALVARQIVERGCQDVLARVGRAGGTSALVFDRAHAHRAADLVVYLRQHHAERDLAELGRLAVAS